MPFKNGLKCITGLLRIPYYALIRADAAVSTYTSFTPASLSALLQLSAVAPVVYISSIRSTLSYFPGDVTLMVPAIFLILAARFSSFWGMVFLFLIRKPASMGIPVREESLLPISSDWLKSF